MFKIMRSGLQAMAVFSLLPRDATQSAFMPQYIVCPSVCNVQAPYRDRIGWNSSKITSRTNSLRPPLWLTPTWAIWCTFIRSMIDHNNSY